MIDIEI